MPNDDRSADQRCALTDRQRNHHHLSYEESRAAQITSKVWKFVKQVHQLHQKKCKIYGAKPVAVDDMVFLAENMICTQQMF